MEGIPWDSVYEDKWDDAEDDEEWDSWMYPSVKNRTETTEKTPLIRKDSMVVSYHVAQN